MTTTDPSIVTMAIPADARFFRSVRLAVGGLAAVVGFDVDAIDDLRIGVDELCAALAESGDGSSLHLEVCADVGALLRIDGYASKGEPGVDEARFAFSRQILSVVADDHGYGADGPRVHCWLERTLVPADVADRV